MIIRHTETPITHHYTASEAERFAAKLFQEQFDAQPEHVQEDTRARTRHLLSFHRHPQCALRKIAHIHGVELPPAVLPTVRNWDE